ncbi:MAG TPA: hypothetical protein VNT42_11655 [Sphingomonas sp.]|nr:hypothetical protein [Sphingomonas sp.]
MTGKIAALSLAALATPCLAQPAPTDRPLSSGTIPTDPALAGTTIGLTPEQREAALEEGAARSGTDIDGLGRSDRRVHGEMGVEIGTRGYRAIYGAAAIPLGNDAIAAFSFDAGSYRNETRRHRR